MSVKGTIHFLHFLSKGDALCFFSKIQALHIQLNFERRNNIDFLIIYRRPGASVTEFVNNLDTEPERRRGLGGHQSTSVRTENKKTL